MSKLFNKAVFMTDLHLGLKNNSVVHNQDCVDFVDWMIAEAKKQGCETCFFLGDWHNHRASINIQTLVTSARVIQKLNDSFDHTYMIAGNHDLYYRDRRDVHSMEWAKNFPKVTIIEDWFSEGGVTIAPWLIGDEHNQLSKFKTDYLFGHFELPGYYMNSMVQMPDHGIFKPNHLFNYEKVYSGHFHKRQAKNNVWYIGNCFPHNFSDVNDDARGIMIKEYGGDEQFYSWPKQPRFRSVLLSEVLDNPDAHLLDRSHVKVHLDIDISFEEAAYIKEALVPKHNLREMSLIKIKPDQLTDDAGSPIKDCMSVNQIIVEQMLSIESSSFDPAVLLAIYNSL